MATCPICDAALPPASFTSPDRLHATSAQSFPVAVCGTCGTGVTLPRVGPEELAAFYPSGYGPYAQPDNPVVALISRVIRWWQGRSTWRARPMAALHAVPPGRGIDVGAGRGDLSVLLQAKGWRMTAIEPSPEATGTIAARGVEARAGVLGTVPLEAGAYDMAVFQQSLEHTPDPVADLRLVHEALRPGGHLLISVPNFGCWQARHLRGHWYHLDLPRHRVHFTPASLGRAAAAAGFRVVGTSTSTSAVGLPASLQYRVAGRCLFPDGLRLRVAAGLCALTLPLAMLFSRVTGGGDMLHLVAVRD